ncbi:cation:proton antiporter [Acidovorax sp. sif1233]|jgi:NhaP-type Na+/H+ or K+/H+ antiporter|uniref:cation:proton antiporter n=1 Tax=Acidovorax sp. sif1233 TaxID=2854792 RepID=UPI001C474C61|nr:cation:proton antiporter [Acidovorax sp. sif1233]MBV7454990.1 cation:proton antiporter [Acidovorax sp. sif1233]
MSEALLVPLGFLLVGLLLVVMTLTSSLISRVPLSSAILYLAVGVGIGPWGLGLLVLDPLGDAALLERLTEIAVLISLFTVGLKLELPLRDARWRIPLQLATVSMLLTVGAIAAVGVWLLRLPLGVSVLLGAILAPTDPVLASDVQVADPQDRDRLRFGLTGEGGLNDGTAFPLVMLGLGLMSLHDLGEGGWRWWAVDVLWAVAGGVGIGFALGAVVGRAILYLRMRHREMLGPDEFMVLGLIALAYGTALLCHAYGFLAVFAAGLALRRVAAQPAGPAPTLAEVEGATEVGHMEPAQAPGHMMQAVERFNAQLERIAEVAVVLVVGALLTVVNFDAEVLWFVPLLLFAIRPLAVYAGLVGTRVKRSQRRLIAWFGIRGIGSVYYLMYAITHGLHPVIAQRLLAITLAVVVASVLLHGISVTPLMRRYEKRKEARRVAED